MVIELLLGGCQNNLGKLVRTALAAPCCEALRIEKCRRNYPAVITHPQRTPRARDPPDNDDPTTIPNDGIRPSIWIDGLALRQNDPELLNTSNYMETYPITTPPKKHKRQDFQLSISVLNHRLLRRAQ